MKNSHLKLIAPTREIRTITPQRPKISEVRTRDKISRYTLKRCDGKELSELFERIRTRVAKETKKRVKISNGGWDPSYCHEPPSHALHSLKTFV